MGVGCREKRWFVLLATALAMVLVWQVWKQVLSRTLLAPWQLVVLPAAGFGFLVGLSTKGWSKRLLLILVIGGIWTAILGDWQRFAFDLQRSAQLATSGDQHRPSEAWLMSKAAEHAKKREAGSGVRREQGIETEKVTVMPQAPRPITLSSDTITRLYLESFRHQVAMLAVSVVLSVFAAIQAARIALSRTDSELD